MFSVKIISPLLWHLLLPHFSNNFFVGWTLAGFTWLLTHPDSIKRLAAFFVQSVLSTKCDLSALFFLYYYVNILYTALNLFCIWDTLIFWLFKPFNFKRTVSSHFVAKNYNMLYKICMWKLSFLKYGNTHIISKLYYKIGRWFIFFRKIIMFSAPLLQN